VVEQRDLLGHSQRVVPRQDHRPGAEQDLLGAGRHVRQEHGVVRTERVVVEVVLDRPEGVEAELIGQPAEADLLSHHLPIGHLALVAPRLKDHLHADTHGVEPRTRRPSPAGLSG
jgi:hypothetical protein